MNYKAQVIGENIKLKKELDLLRKEVDMLREELEKSKVKPESGIDRLIKEIEKLKIFKK